MATDVEIILQRASIADVVGKFIEIQKKGNSYVAVCPFHNDSSPSLNISVDKKIFKCFACGAGGNAITFVERYKSISFVEALTIVGEMVGVEIKHNRNIRPKYNNLETKIISMNKDIANYFSSILFTTQGKKARQYLEKRNINLNMIRNFEIGFAPSKTKFAEFLIQKRNYTESEIESSALFKKKGLNFNSVFFNRIMFPIKNYGGEIVGFSGRIIDDGSPKYLNTSDNVLFKKNKIAYNFSDAESEIRMKDSVVILEGYMDVISLVSSGIKNVVAIMGTTLSDENILILSKVTKNFTLFLDGDEAGVSAAIKNSKKLLSSEINVKIVYNDTKLDPDELIQSGKQNIVEQLIHNAKSPSDFVLEIIKQKTESSSSVGDNVEYINFAFDLFIYLNKIALETSMSKLSAITNVDINSLKEEFENYKNKFGKNKVKKVIDKPNVEISSVSDFEMNFDPGIPDDVFNEMDIPLDYEPFVEQNISETFKLPKKKGK